MSGPLPEVARRSRLFLDISMLVRWVGPAVGMVRVEAELARYAIEQRPDIDFVVYDSRIHRYRIVKRDIVPLMIGGNLFVDQTGLPDPRSTPRHWLGRLLNDMDRSLLFIRRPRRACILALERLRTWLAPSHRFAAEWLQSHLLNDRYRRLLFDSEGYRRSLIEFSMIVEGEPPALRGATVLTAGAEWNTKNPDRLRRLKDVEGFRLVMVCYDLIPILFPEFFLKRDRDLFSAYFDNAIDFIDKFICISNCTARDLAGFLAGHGQRKIDLAVHYLGSNLHETTQTELPSTLKSKRYILFVSTIEPRKNHDMLYRVWLRLLERGIPQKHEFQLVFVGQPGWDTEELVRKLESDTENQLRYFRVTNDSKLACLYKNAAFCVYPSRYEGFGLPIVEAFHHGRAVVASNAGSIPEVVRNLGPCLDPQDEDAWFQTLSRWIEDPSVVTSHEQAISKNFVYTPWSEVASRYFATAELGPADDASQPCGRQPAMIEAAT